jgi:hypothetical protein
LYEVTLETQDIVPGQAGYNVDPTVVFMLDVYIRQNATVQGVQWANDFLSITSWSNNNDVNPVWVQTLGYDPYVGQAAPYAFWGNVNNYQTPWVNNNASPTEWVGYTAPVPIPPVPPGPPIQLNPSAIDRIIVPFSRSDYASVANKGMQGFPTSFWYDKLLQPTMYLWPVPNQFIPNGLQYYVMKRPCDADLADGTKVQIPYEFYDYYVWGLAERLAFIYAPDKLALISPRKQQAWQRAMQASTENVPINIDTMLGSYFRV